MSDYRTPTNTEIEDAIISCLKNLQAGGKKIFQTVASYGGRIESEEWIARITEFPAIYVAFAGEASDPKQVPSGFYESPIFRLVMMARNLSGEQQARQGGIKNDKTNEYGAYDLLEFVKAALNKADLSLKIADLIPSKVKPIILETFETLKISCYSIHYQTNILRQYSASEQDLDAIQTDFNGGFPAEINLQQT